MRPRCRSTIPRQQQPGQLGEGGDVDRDLTQILIPVAFPELAVAAEASVVDEDLNLALRTEFLDDRLGGASFGQVGGDDTAVGAVLLLQLRRKRGQLGFAPSDENEVVSLARQDVGELTADDGRGSGDNCNGSRAGHANTLGQSPMVTSWAPILVGRCRARMPCLRILGLSRPESVSAATS
jgi:hypothetical protein